MSRPNIVVVIADDHATHALSCYGSEINTTPAMDRLAAEGIRFDSAACTNSLCAPSRATLLTGTYSHVNGVRTLDEEYDATQPAFPAMLQAAGYQTAVIGKWHLGHGGRHDPRGFDHWSVLRGQGSYDDPEFLTADGARVHPGYVTELITDQAEAWLAARDRERPFFLLVAHKAPHRPWISDEAHAHLYRDDEVVEPATLLDDYAHRARAAREARMRVGRDLTEADLKEPTPEGLDESARTRWSYQRYIGEYLRVVASLDDNVGRLTDALERDGVLDETLVVYTSDQGFFLGDHGWYDKRFMYEESLRIPLLVRYPPLVAAGSTNDDLVLNVDLAQTFLDLAGVPAHPRMQGRSLLPLLAGEQVDDWRTSFYYRYWEHLSRHNVPAHWGSGQDTTNSSSTMAADSAYQVQSRVTQLQSGELFDLVDDPHELHSRYDDPTYSTIRGALVTLLHDHQHELGDTLGIAANGRQASAD